MTSTPNPTWYDVLGLDHDATPAEIKAAWRHATDHFEPGSGSGQFRMFNDAADVLLDPERRRVYDATLTGSAPATDAATEEPAGRAAAEPAVPAEDATDEPAVAPRRKPRATRTRTGAAPRKPSRADSALVTALGGIRTWVLALLAVLTVAVLVAATLVGLKLHGQAAISDARIEAPPAAEQAVKALFSYDYRSLDAERARAGGYMTPAFAKTYFTNFDALEKQKDGTPGLAIQTKAVVTASVQGSGIVDADAHVARVLVFVNLVSVKGTSTPQIFQNRVAMTMTKTNGRWLVSNVNSY